jgi:hypothetical protein
MSLDFIQTPYGRLNWFEAHTPDEKEFRKTALMLPKTVEAMQSLIDQGLPKEIAETNIKDVEAMIAEVAKQVKEDGKAKSFNVRKKLFKDGDAYSDDRIQQFEDNPENEGKPVPDYLNTTRGFYILNMKTKFALEFYGPKKSEGVRDDTWADSNLYNGCWARMLVKPYPYKVEGNQGYALGLSKFIQKWCDDENFGSGSSSSSSTGGASVEVDDVVEFTPKAKTEDYIN